jgi:PhnB protein
MTTTAATDLQLVPFVFFYGRCEEALEFYKQAIGGTYELQRIGETPMAADFPKESHQRVMHAIFKGGGMTFMASDGRETKQIDPEEGNVILALASTDSAQGERIFTALSVGGTVRTPLGEVFWGGKFGSLIDRFGIEWMVTTP